MITLLFFLSSGLFLGWSLGANDAANIFGTAVGSRMVKFKQAAIIASLFVIVGAVVQGAGASETLGKLGNVSALAGAFTVALSAGLTVYWMTRWKLPVSTSQAIVGAIIGWNFYTGNQTDFGVLAKIVTTWVSGPVLGAVFAALLYLLVKKLLERVKFHIIYRDLTIRWGLIIVGAFGAYSLGANNIANVMGVFTTAVSFPELDFGLFKLSGTQQLFAIGGLAIALGIITYSKRVMETVGNTLMPLTSEAALIVVLSQSLVLFIFSSQSLSEALHSVGLPSIPLVPVSSSQAVIGSIIGIGLLKGGQQIKYNVLGSISLGWIATPLVAGAVSFFLLFFVHNVFQQDVGTVTMTNGIEQTTVPTGRDGNVQPVHHISSTATSGTVNARLWIVLFILTVLLAYTIYHSSRSKRKLREDYKKKIDRLEKEYKLKTAMLERDLENYKQEQRGLDKELRYHQNEMATMATNIIRRYEFITNLKKDINQIKKGLKDPETRQTLNNLVLKINQNLMLDRDREKFEMHLQEHNTNFLHRLEKTYQGLTENEKRLAVLLRMGLTSKEIASILNISPKSVEMNRYRLRKKLQVPPKQSLTEFVKNF